MSLFQNGTYWIDLYFIYEKDESKRFDRGIEKVPRKSRSDYSKQEEMRKEIIKSRLALYKI